MPSSEMLRVLSWNLNARTTRLPEQLAAIAALSPDLISLQEVTATSAGRLSEALAGAGYATITGRDLARTGSAPLPRFVLLASRLPCVRSPRLPVPAPEVCLALSARWGGTPLTFVGVHIPTSASSRGPLLKLETQEGLLAALARRRGRIIVAGDLNAPKAETGPGQVVAFSPRSRAREHAAEVAFHTRGPGFRLHDAFRRANGYDPQDQSWAWKNRGKTGGFRLDHILATRSLRPARCWYEHGLREAGLSDHSPLVADFTL